jgi:hypothetical protein
MVEQICPNCNKSYNAENGYCERCGFVGWSSDILIPSGTILKNRYKLQKLGHGGGISYLYLAQDKNLFERRCVIKRFKERIHSKEHRTKLRKYGYTPPEQWRGEPLLKLDLKLAGGCI